ncbi:MAG: hypothetical protein AAF489_09385 [Bacteroidota bacterium]
MKISFRITAVLLLFCVSMVSAQSTYKESFNVGDDVLVSVNTSHTNVVFETWNKDVVQVEAFIDDENLSAKEKEEVFKNWDLDVLGNSKKVVITSNDGSLWGGFESMGNLKALSRLESLESLNGLEALKELKNMPLFEQLGNVNWDFSVPDIPDFEKFDNWPFSDDRPSIISQEGNVNFSFNSSDSRVFDRGKYKRDKQAYVNKLNKKYGGNATVRETDAWLDSVDEWAEDFEKVMEDWGENFGKQFEEQFGPEFEKKMEKWGEQFGAEMEKWGEEFGEKFGKDMEEWGEEFGKDMEKWAEQFEKNAEKWAEQFSDEGGNVRTKVITTPQGNKTVIINGESDNGLFDTSKKAKKTIIIKMPKGTKTDINVRHGEVKMADAVNLKATLNYAKLSANSIDGGETLINAAYAPVYVNNWQDGVLDLSYVEDCKLNNVKKINLMANSSNVNINSLIEEAFLSGSFGSLFVNKISDKFESVDVVLENTDATLSLPKAAFNLHYNGKKSRFKTPTALNVTTNTQSESRALVKGYFGARNTGRSFTINASYSNITFQ